MSQPQFTIDRAPMLMAYMLLSGRVGGLIRVRPSLAQRLVFAPPEAMHGIAAYLFHGVPAGLADSEVAEIIDTHHPRDLMLRALPHAPIRLYRALRRGPDRVCAPNAYLRAAAIAAGPFADQFLAGDPLSDYRLDFYEVLSGTDPDVRRLHRALPEDCSTVGAVDVAVQVLRAFGTLKPDSLALPPTAGRKALYRRLLRCLDAIPAPDLPFTVPAPYRLIDSIGALRREGLRMNNCLRDDRWQGPRKWFSLARGERVFVASDDPVFMAEFTRVAPDTFCLSEFAGPDNTPVLASARTDLVAALRGAGAQIIDRDPAAAWSRLCKRLGQSRSVFVGGGGDLGDDLDLPDLDGLAA